jgi:hypothetical protein
MIALYREQLDRCCGPVHRPLVKRVLTGIEKEQQEHLDSIQKEYQREFVDGESK